MSTVWQTQQRLFFELLQELADWLSDEEQRIPVVPGEQMARLLTVVVTLLQQHHVNKRGRCQFCNWTRWKWRFWRRRRRCTVHEAIDVVLSQNMDVVWRLLLECGGLAGADVSHDQGQPPQKDTGAQPSLPIDNP